jgi:3-isopropylmalate/(R)-2-methylmalate dehydratase large subunit
MTVDLGAMNGIVEPDDRTAAYLDGRARGDWEPVESDPDAEYEEVYEIDISEVSPKVSRPDKIDDVVPIEEVAGTEINKVFVGTCTNGRLEDIAVMAEILDGQQIHPNVNMIVVPASQQVYLDAVEKGYVSSLVKAGAAVDTPSCASCAGIHTGVLGDDDVVVSAGNRNMKGRMGSRKAEIYLSSPAVAAASAIEGVLADPRQYPATEREVAYA